ncbi:MAG: mercuric reductase [Chloroflexi bacterium]|nr:mercuric reductase [Chloroflexota bacterium]
MSEAYDLVVIGAGSAGLTASAFAAQLGLSVALVEKDRLGGDCTWTGCIPSKTLLNIANTVHEVAEAAYLGMDNPQRPQRTQIDLKKVMSRVREAVERVYSREAPDLMESSGIQVIQGEARFIDPHTLAVGDAQLKARRFLIATGARPFIPPIPGLNETGYLTYQTVWDLEELPASLVVMGAGPIGCELAQAFCRLGSRVTLVEGADRILLHDEPEAAQVLAQSLTGEGVDLRLGHMVEGITQNGKGVKVTLGQEELTGDALLVAVGRRPNVDDLGLDRAEVAFGPQGIGVDRRLRTSQKHIYAAGDCAGGHQFTHYAGWQGFMAVRNAFLPGSTRAVLESVPWTTFTDPEVSHAGLTEAEARARFGSALEVSTWPMASVDRAVTAGGGDEPGFIKVVHKKNGTVLGATVVSRRAGEMIHEWTLAIDNGISLGAIAKSIHVYPTYSMGNMQLAAEVQVDRLLSGKMGGLVRWLARLGR